MQQKFESKEASAHSPLSADQWQGLARLADLIQALESGLGTDLGGDLVKNIGRWTEALNGDVPTALRAATDTLTTLHQNGILSQLQMVLKMVSQVPEFWQEVVPERLM